MSYLIWFSLIGCIVPLLLALTWASIDGWGSGKVESLLAIAAVIKGYRCVFTTTDKQSKEKVDALKAS